MCYNGWWTLSRISVRLDNSNLRRFNEESGGLYGAKFYSPNMHSLLHLKAEYQHFGDLHRNS